MPELPHPTEDLEVIKSNIDEFGYGLLANGITPEQVEAGRIRLTEQAAAEARLGTSHHDAGPNGSGVNQRLWFLINKGQVFRDFLLNRRVRELVGHILGDDYLLSSFTANIARPGGIVEPHTDQWWMPKPTFPGKTVVKPGSMTREKARGAHIGGDATAKLPMIPPAVACNAMWMLTDFTAENGATLVVPGSHLWGREPDKARDTDIPWVQLTAPAGTVAVFEARTWHSTGANTGTTDRLGALTYFCAPIFRQQENIAMGVSDEVLASASEELLGLIGYKLWQGYGRIESPRNPWIRPGQKGLGELRPDDVA